MALSGEFPVKKLCQLMGVNRSSYYAWANALLHPSTRRQRLLASIKLFIEYHHQYPSHGYRWLNAKIRLDKDIMMSDPYALKCCRLAGLKSQASRCLKRYRGAGNPFRLYPNILLAGLTITGPLQCLVSDMTAFWAYGHYYELTLYMDLWNDEIVAHSLSGSRGDRMTYISGLEDVIERKEAEVRGCQMILHTDQGSVYASKAFNDMLALHNIIHSMSRAGTPTDNAAMESINGWIKAELFTDLHITGKRPVREEIDDYIRFFNEGRPAYCLNYLTPKQYREKYAPAAAV